MNPKLRTLIRGIMAVCVVYIAAYLVLLYYHRIVGGVYNVEDHIVVVATWGRTWDLSPVIAFAIWGICGGYLLDKGE